MLVAVGVNQKSATVSDRERVAVPAEDVGPVAGGHAALDGVDEVVLLSTCCRVEIYAATRCPTAAVVALRGALAARAGNGALPTFQLQGADALRHLLRVASSLESAVLGETQILGQLKQAHQRAADAGAVGKELSGVLARAYQAAKRVRTETAVGRAGVSWGSATVVLAEKVLGPLRGRRALVVGAGEMARVAARHLRDEGAEITVVNRTLAHGQVLAGEVGGTALPLDALEAELRRCDVVVSAAPAGGGAFAPASLAAVMKQRRRRDLVIVDLAVPRAIPAESSRLDGVWLCDVDDLARLTQRAREERARAVADAERIVEEEIASHAREQAERRAAPVIQAMRTRAAEIAREEVDRTARRIGADAEVEKRLAALANAVVSKLLHAPSARLRQAGSDGVGGDRLISAAVEIFGLPFDGAPPAAG